MRPVKIVDVRLFQVEGEAPAQDWEDRSVRALDLYPEHLAASLVSTDPLATERVHDEMLRLHRHGRAGLFVTAISAVDNALWDLRGKARDEPVHRLLGGPTRDKVPACASMLARRYQEVDG
jgi:L-alanine-DL-glutamate epimerase-like enolase superfamily enzyme